MAQRIVFHYFPGNSCLHRWDPRCKFFGLLAITATLVRVRIEWLILDSVLFLGLLLLSRLPLKSFFCGLWSWMIFLFLLFLFQVLFTPGTPIARIPWIPLSREGLRLGTLTFFRLALLLCYAILFTAITRPRGLQDALVWVLKPFPFLPGRRIGLMVSLVLGFFSLTLDQAEEVRLALKARLGDRHRNPLRKARFLALPILRRSLSRAEDVTLALAARGYSDDIPLRFPSLPLLQMIPVLCLLVLFLTLK
jgi:energy-coupling factor transporter transmembrane protein EcfT